LVSIVRKTETIYLVSISNHESPSPDGRGSLLTKTAWFSLLKRRPPEAGIKSWKISGFGKS